MSNTERKASDVLKDLIERASNITGVNLHDHHHLQPEAQEALYTDILKLVGEDDKQDWDDDMSFCQNCGYQPSDSQDCICVFKNQLRAELRTKLKEYFGQDSTGAAS